MFKNNSPIVLGARIASVLMLVLIVLVSVIFDKSISLFTGDVTSLAEMHPLSGMLSNMGIYLWCVSATASYFAAAVVYHNKQTEYVSFLLSSALLSSYLMFDDAFLFHEYMAPYWFGIGEKGVILALGIAVLAYLVFHFRTIQKTNYKNLILAFGFLSLSVFIDALQPWLEPLGQWRSLMEDGTKWLGIASWCIYHVQTGFGCVLGSKAEVKDNKVHP